MTAEVELWIKVPAPFFGAEAVGVSVRCPETQEPGPLRDVPLFVEGDRELISPLLPHLRLLPDRSRLFDPAALGEAYGWSQPIQLTDEVVLMSFMDRSHSYGAPDPGQAARNRLSNQLVPLVFPFLRDCVMLAGLRLKSEIVIELSPGEQPALELSLPLEKIVSANGTQVLGEP